MISIVGLGNPGEQYRHTRHNVGWDALCYIIEKHTLPSFVETKKYAGLFSECVYEDKEVTFLLPTTYMNKSGTAVKKLMEVGNTKNELIVIYDDIDLPVGEIKISYDRGSGGHNGIKSIINALGTKEFTRIRIGVASKGLFGGVRRPKGERLSKHVLGTFSKKEAASLQHVFGRVDEALTLLIREGRERAMNVYNA